MDPVAQQPTVQQPVSQPMAAPQSITSAVSDKASFLQRFAALFVDAILIAIVNAVITYVFNMLHLSSLGTLITSLSFMIYAFYFTLTQSATLGKKALKIKVVSADGKPLTPLQVFLREVVGKFISAIVILLGYFWMLWDKDKQTWHDKIAGTYVVKA